ncbi:hypothetical protein HB852_09850 [Listeria grandensis]|uniref:hypothetical protein n=1 Tax=Listeria grandensis TaxID=1494963 RepID=UPI00162957C4|nr:hypothetical protein [Listeria grandensis]MBC1474920.1 hypothetical protein [Listeria grandensis]
MHLSEREFVERVMKKVDAGEEMTEMEIFEFKRIYNAITDLVNNLFTCLRQNYSVEELEQILKNEEESK